MVLFFRGGALVSKTGHAIESELPDDELLEGFLLEFYGGGRPVTVTVEARDGRVRAWTT